jgi:hypothetical protein
MKQPRLLDAFGSPTDGSPEDVRLDFLLAAWSVWMRQGSVGRGLPTKSVGLRSTSGQDFESMLAAVDTRLARALDAIIDSLQPRYRDALHHRWLRSAWTWGEAWEVDYQAARDEVRRLMRKRNIE